MAQTAEVCLVGAAPGEPDLLACIAPRILRPADAIVICETSPHGLRHSSRVAEGYCA